MASSAPPSPAIAADIPNTTTRVRTGEIPIDWAATSLPRIACSWRPVVLRVRSDTPTDTTTSTTATSARKALSLAKSQAPMSGRGTRVAAWADEPPTQETFHTTASKKKAKAGGAEATHTPLRGPGDGERG